MPLKPNILADLAADNWIAAPPSRERYTDPDVGENKVMIEDESGRLRLTGSVLKEHLLVTGVIVAVMGTENKDGEFEVLDLKVAGLSSQPPRYFFQPTPANPSATDKDLSKVALVSGLQLTGETASTLTHDLLLEFLIGEASSSPSRSLSSQISRLFILGNSLAESNPLATRDDSFAPQYDLRKSNLPLVSRKYGYDASTYNPAPTTQLDEFLSALLPSLSITLMPGETDPANVSIPQQPLHPALFPRSRAYVDPPNPRTMNTTQGTYSSKKKERLPPLKFPFHSATNPSYISLEGILCLFCSGQPTADMLRYISSSQDISTLDLMEATLQWRLIAPTAPDTLWCYPYQSRDPFVVNDKKCPDLYAVGNSDRFGTRMIHGREGQNVRLISVPNFSASGEIVLVDIRDLSCQRIKITVNEEHGEGNITASDPVN